MLSVLQIQWDAAVEKVKYQYIIKNKKKEHSHIIGQLSSIKIEVRDLVLKRYLARCKLSNALAFF